MRILYITKGLKDGGLTSILIDRVNYIAEHTDFDIHLLSDCPNDPKKRRKVDKRVHFHLIAEEEMWKKNRNLPIIGYLSMVSTVKKRLKIFIAEIKPDLITVFNPQIPYKRLIPLVKTRVPKIIEFHGSYNNEKITKNVAIAEAHSFKAKIELVPLFLKLASLKLKKTLLENRYDYAVSLTREDLEGRKSLKVKKKQIYNPVPNPSHIKAFRKRKNQIIAIGKLNKFKNFKALLEAVNRIKNELRNWEVHLYGKGPEEASLRQKIAQYNLGDIVKLKGYSYNMPEVYNSSKILVSTSLREGHPMNILEAFNYHIPVISYDCKCGPKEIITDGVNGFLIAPEVGLLAEKLLQLTQNPSLLASFSAQTKRDFDKFDLEKIMKEWILFYKLIVKKEAS